MGQTSALPRSETIQKYLNPTPLFYKLEGAGFVYLHGKTQKEYLQRQTTNDLGLMQPDRAIHNALADPSGKVIDVFHQFLYEDGMALLPFPGRGQALFNYLAKRIFFNDQVEIEDLGEAWNQYWLVGILSELGLDIAPELKSSYTTGHLELAGIDCQIIRLPDISAKEPIENFLLLVPRQSATKLEEALAQAECRALTQQDFEILRILQGEVGGGEMGGKYTPFELGLADIVSGKKGCYTGQEVLARQVTYSKISKGPVLLSSDQRLQPGSRVLMDGQVVGASESSTETVDLGAISLAILRLDRIHHGDEVQIRSDSGEVSARIVHILTQP